MKTIRILEIKRGKSVIRELIFKKGQVFTISVKYLPYYKINHSIGEIIDEKLMKTNRVKTRILPILDKAIAFSANKSRI